MAVSLIREPASAVRPLGFPGRYQHRYPTSTTPQTPLLFVLGRPGSGKSTIRRFLMQELPYHEISFFDDYQLLREMAQEDEQLTLAGRATPPRFEVYHLDGGQWGFKILDFRVLADVLEKLNTRLLHQQQRPNSLHVVEFARSTYTTAEIWQLFDPVLLMSAHYLYTDAGLETCVERVMRRSQYLPPDIMRAYYGQDGLPSLFHSRGASRVEVLNTECSEETTRSQLRRALGMILGEQLGKYAA